MTEKTNNLGLNLLIQSQAQKEVTINEALVIIDALLNTGVKSKSLSTPPETPTNGDLYIVGASPNDDWLDKENQVAWYDGAWRFIIPKEGLTLWVSDNQSLFTFNGTTWQESGYPSNTTINLSDFNIDTPADNQVLKYDSASGKWINVTELTGLMLQNLDKLGIGTSADDNNKLAVSSPYVLLNNAGNGCQLKINKNAQGDSSSLLFQSNWTGYAEFGLIGDNEFALKVSADGSNWFEAFKCDGATGRIFFKHDNDSMGHVGDLKETVSAVNYDHGNWLKLESTTRDVSRTTYATLFAKIGETYGVGDGSTTFGLPTYSVAGRCGFIFTGH